MSAAELASPDALVERLFTAAIAAWQELATLSLGLAQPPHLKPTAAA